MQEAPRTDKRSAPWGLVALPLLLLPVVVWWHFRPRAAIEAGSGLATSAEASARVADLPTVRNAVQRPIVSPESIGALATINGSVISTLDGTAIPEATVVLAREGATRSARTNASGDFVFGVNEAGRYAVVSVTAEGFAPFAPETENSPVAVMVRRGSAVRDVRIALAPLVRAQVRVVAENVVGYIQGARVRSLRPDGEPLDEAAPPTDSNGQTTLTVVEGATLEGSHPEFPTTRVTYNVRGMSRGYALLRLRARGPSGVGSVRGTVRSADGEPLEGALVRLNDGPATVAAARTAADGTFSLREVGAGPLQISATAPGYVAYEASTLLRVGQVLERELRLVRSASVRGVVRTVAGTPPPGRFTVLATNTGRLRPIASVSTADPEGNFELTGLGPGSYQLRAEADGFAPSAPVALTVPREGSVPETPLTLGDDGVVGGRVVDARTGQPVVGAQVERELLDAPPLPTGVALQRGTTTDARGAFELHGMPPSFGGLRVTAPRYATRSVQNVPLNGGDSSALTVQLTPLSGGSSVAREYSGIGVGVARNRSGWYLTFVVPAGPAARAQLRATDLLVRVNGEPLDALGYEQVLQRLQGPEGSVVVLTVQHLAGDAGVASGPVDVPISRATIRGRL